MPTELPSISRTEEMTETRHIRKLWGRLGTPIHIIYEAWDAKRWTREMEKMGMERRKELAIHRVLKNLTDSDQQIVADWLVSIGPLVTTGDLFAMQYVLLVLVNMYGSKHIKLHDAWRTEDRCISEGEDAIDFLKEDIVLIGGPAGNPITYRALSRLGALSLFPDAPDNDLRIRKWGTEEFVFPCIYDAQRNDSDFGLFLCGKNPWGENSNFFAPMGSLSWGTQAAGALACSELGAQMLLEGNEIKGKDPVIASHSWMKGIGYVEVMPQSGESLPKLVVPECDFRVVWPQNGPTLKNPERILITGDRLKKEPQQILKAQTQELEQFLGRYLPHRRTFRISFFSTVIMIVSILSHRLFNIEIIHPFWATIGLFISCGFLLMSYFFYLEWKKGRQE
jgi:hypothetical protein